MALVGMELTILTRLASNLQSLSRVSASSVLGL